MIDMEQLKIIKPRIQSRSGTATRLKRPALAGTLLLAAALFGSPAVHAQAGDPGIVSYPDTGIGVEGTNLGLPKPLSINHNPAPACTSQALSIDVGEEVSSLDFTYLQLERDENDGEFGQWEAFDENGLAVGIGQFTSSSDDGTGSETIESPALEAPARYFVFSALPYGGSSCESDGEASEFIFIDSSDYILATVSYSTSAGPQSYPQSCSGPVGCGWAGLNPAGFDFDVDYTSGDQYVGAPIVIDDETCTGDGSDNEACLVELAEDFIFSVQDAPDVSGDFTINGVTTELDRRTACGYTGEDPLGPGPQALPLPQFPMGSGKVATVPAELCGIPDPEFDNQPTIKVIDVDSNLSVISSVLEVSDTEDRDTDAGYIDDFVCLEGQEIVDLGAGADAARSKLPVVGYLPKLLKDGLPTTELPVFNAGGGLANTVIDTTYACNGARGRRARLSYTFYHMRHRPDLERGDYVVLIDDAIKQLNATVLQSYACTDSFYQFWLTIPALFSWSAFTDGDYALAKARYETMLWFASLDFFLPSTESCVYNLTSMKVESGTPGVDTVPRNFRGDKITQISHILYMLDRMLGQVYPPLPSDFDPTP